MKKFIVLMAIVALAGFAQAELFVNGDFEAGGWSGGGSGSGAGGPSPWGWTTFPPIYQQDSGGSDGGDWMQLDQSAAPYTGTWNWAWSGVWSTKIAVTPGLAMTVSGMAQHLTGDTTLRAFVSYEDAAGLRVDLNNDGISQVLGNGVQADYLKDRYMPTWVTDAGWDPFTLDYSVPIGYSIAQLDFTFSVEAAPGAVGIDQLSLIPEPMTIGLLGLGGLFLRRRKA